MVVSVEDRKFSHPCVFNASLKEFPLEFCNGDSGQKYYQTVERLWWYVQSFRYNTKMWRTDRRTKLLKQYRALHAQYADTQ